ncbi:tumor necrosis factor receptor superfamily member 19L [Paramormyrops kingsleyae]|uniref:RELT TNF receptor n=1 Tax=Paramormyrops kingsleyae TaxID=1676925 RepID=A0A3B3QRG8_9TELE|nr:tumor necrosis factor receptor superfamily member 19L-like [Paramormyrops kingsleyae]XP_023648183.1 tumor necrosis factor receptor superfamily member 19L-like [Paramormyrops kingsleyae]XP_023648184.1 tumor necrosis factor receptor superfamily member 19L-like [Paramormyrops kingsleyae]
MMRNRLYSAALVLLALFSPGDSQAAAQCGGGQVLTSQGCVCLHCPRGQEPNQPCGRAVEAAGVLRCQACPAGTFSDGYDAEPCRPHRSCSALNRVLVWPGRARSDTLCGRCLRGFSSPTEATPGGLQACVTSPLDPLVRVARSVSKSTPHVNTTNVRGTDETAEYAVFALVPVFCVTGLLGILICNILKKKGYNCTGDKEGGVAEVGTPHKEASSGPYIVDDPNEDTISVLVRLITEKKENAAALEELLLEYESQQAAINKTSALKLPALPPLVQFRSLPRLCPHQRHPHTINGLALHSGTYCCSRCSQKKWPELLLTPSTHNHAQDHSHKQKGEANKPAQASLPGEVTILSVGRFQVAQIPDPLDANSPELSDNDSVDTARMEPAEETSLLGVHSSTSSIGQRTKSKQEVNC